LIEKREKIANELFEKYKDEIQFTKDEKKLTSDDKLKLVANYMPPEPALDSVVYQVNTGYIKSHGSSSKIVDKETNEKRYASTLISAEELLENPNLTGYYNVAKYLDAFNSRVSSILTGFDEEVCNKMLSNIKKVKSKDEFGNKLVTETLLPEINGFKPEELVLKSFDSDIFEESMFLEEMEVEFWNKTGYDPRLIWNGFGMSENNKVYYEIYEGALNFLNEKMKAKDKPLIKSINDNYEKDDLVLIKDGSHYHVGVFNGVYIGIIRENVEVPKTEIELELDKKREEQQEKIKNLETLGAETEREKHLKVKLLKREKFFDGFKKEFRLPANITMEKLFTQEPSASTAFDNYVYNMENQLEQEAAEFDDMDSGGDDSE
jgi:hypothetical protein